MKVTIRVSRKVKYIISVGRFYLSIFKVKYIDEVEEWCITSWKMLIKNSPRGK